MRETPLAQLNADALAEVHRLAPCAADEPARRIGRIALFAGLDVEALREIEKSCRWQTVAAGEPILERDDDGGDVYFVLRGAVQVVNYSLGGREIGLGRVVAGDFFGELSALDGEPRSASFIATEECQLACMPPRAFDRLLRAHPDLAAAVLRRLAGVIRRANDRIMDVSTLSAGQRVIVELLRLAKAERSNGNRPAGERISTLPAHREIAAQASTTRETVARTISQLANEGLIERDNKGIAILDRALLEDVAAEQDPGRFTDRRTGLDRRRLHRAPDGGLPPEADRRSGADRRRAI